MQRDVLVGVDHHRPADEDGCAVMLDGFNDRTALGPVSTGREANQVASRQGFMDRRLHARRHFAFGREKRSVEINRNHPVARHRFLTSFGTGPLKRCIHSPRPMTGVMRMSATYND